MTGKIKSITVPAMATETTLPLRLDCEKCKKMWLWKPLVIAVFLHSSVGFFFSESWKQSS